MCLPKDANRNQGLWKNGEKITRWRYLRQSNKDQPGSRYLDGTAGVNEHSCCSPYVVYDNCAARGRVFVLQHATRWYEQPMKGRDAGANIIGNSRLN